MKKSSTRTSLIAIGWSALASLSVASLATAELTVRTSPVFFNPSIGRSAKIHVAAPRPGEITVEILDRDHFLVRSLATIALESEIEVSWDGKDDSGTVVPNEAYSIRIRFDGVDGRSEIYDPGSAKSTLPVSVTSFSYSRVDGVINYRLDAPSRVHIQAGQLPQPPAIGAEGPILHTVVDRAPRTGGAISEKWHGFDDSRTVYIPDLPGFVMAILASPLPANALITTGSRGENFAAYAARHRPAQVSIREQVFGPELQHHQGLTAIQDRSPRLSTARLTQGTGAIWTHRSGEKLQVLIGLEPTFEPVFVTPRARLHIFRDATLITTLQCNENPCSVDLPSTSLSTGRHRLVANWDSGLGPVGVGVRILEIQ